MLEIEEVQKEKMSVRTKSRFQLHSELKLTLNSSSNSLSETGCWLTKVLMFEQAAEQQTADFLHRVLRGEGDGCNKMVLLTATLYLAQEVL